MEDWASFPAIIRVNHAVYPGKYALGAGSGGGAPNKHSKSKRDGPDNCVVLTWPYSQTMSISLFDIDTKHKYLTSEDPLYRLKKKYCYLKVHISQEIFFSK